jgi:hypothetical protein
MGDGSWQFLGNSNKRGKIARINGATHPLAADPCARVTAEWLARKCRSTSCHHSVVAQPGSACAMDLRHLVAIKQEGDEEVTGRQGRRSEDSRTLALREMHMPRMRAGRRWTSQLRAVLAKRRRVTQRRRHAQRATVPPWMLEEGFSGFIPRTKAERNAHADTKQRGRAAANLTSLFNIHQRRQHTMQSSFDYVSDIVDHNMVQPADQLHTIMPMKYPLSDAPMIWGEYVLFREFHPPLAFCAFMASQLRRSQFKDSRTGERIGNPPPFREDHDPVATQAMWTHIALWDNTKLGFPCPVEWTFRETDELETFSKKFIISEIDRIMDVAAKLHHDAEAVLKCLDADEASGECAEFLLGHAHGMPSHLTIWESKTWCRHALHQSTALRAACETLIAGRRSLYDQYIAEGTRMARGERMYDVVEYFGDYSLISADGDEIIPL